MQRLEFNHWVTKIPWRRKWQPAPVFLPGKSYGQRSLVGYGPWGSKESDVTEWLSTHTHKHSLKLYQHICQNVTCLLRNLYAGKEAKVRTGHGTTDWFQIGKGVYCHPAYLTYMQSTSWETLGWKKHKLESRLPGELSITSDMQMTPPLWQKVKRN